MLPVFNQTEELSPPPPSSSSSSPRRVDAFFMTKEQREAHRQAELKAQLRKQSEESKRTDLKLTQGKEIHPFLMPRKAAASLSSSPSDDVICLSPPQQASSSPLSMQPPLSPPPPVPNHLQQVSADEEVFLSSCCFSTARPRSVHADNELNSLSALDISDGPLLFASVEEMRRRIEAGSKDKEQEQKRGKRVWQQEETQRAAPVDAVLKAILPPTNIDDLSVNEAQQIFKRYREKSGRFSSSPATGGVPNEMTITTGAPASGLGDSYNGHGGESSSSSSSSSTTTTVTNEGTRWQLWTHKYRPRCAEEVIGHRQAVAALVGWLSEWRNRLKAGALKKNTKKKEQHNKSSKKKRGTASRPWQGPPQPNVLLIRGPTGVGKTGSDSLAFQKESKTKRTDSSVACGSCSVGVCMRRRSGLPCAGDQPIGGTHWSTHQALCGGGHPITECGLSLFQGRHPGHQR